MQNTNKSTADWARSMKWWQAPWDMASSRFHLPIFMPWSPPLERGLDAVTCFSWIEHGRSDALWVLWSGCTKLMTTTLLLSHLLALVKPAAMFGEALWTGPSSRELEPLSHSWWGTKETNPANNNLSGLRSGALPTEPSDETPGPGGIMTAALWETMK